MSDAYARDASEESVSSAVKANLTDDEGVNLAIIDFARTLQLLKELNQRSGPTSVGWWD